MVKDLIEEEEKAEQDPRVCVTVIGSTPDTPVMKFRKSKLNSHVWRRKNVKKTSMFLKMVCATQSRVFKNEKRFILELVSWSGKARDE